MDTCPGRVGIQQRFVPVYRVPFFDWLAGACAGGLSVFAGEPPADEAAGPVGRLSVARHAPTHNIYLTGGVRHLCYQRGIVEWLEGWRPDLLIVEANPRYISTPAALRWMKRRGKPVVGWGLGAPVLSGVLSALYRSAWLRFLKQFDALITYSQRGVAEYVATGYPRERIFVAPNAVAPRPRHGLPKRRKNLAQTASVLYVGRLQERKRVDHLLRACAALPVELRPRLVIVGDGPERRKLEVLSARIYPQAQFTGAVHGDGLAPYYAAADLFVLPGTGGLAVQEAMAFGLPVIVAQGDGTQDDLVRPENGWQVPSDDLTSLIAVLRIALSDMQRLRPMGVESYRIIDREVNLESMVGVFVTVINRLMNKRVK